MFGTRICDSAALISVRRSNACLSASSSVRSEQPGWNVVGEIVFVAWSSPVIRAKMIFCFATSFSSEMTAVLC